MNESNDWMLESLTISKSWQHQQHYQGNVTFKNGVKMQMSLVLDNAAAVKMISLLQGEIVESAKNLGDLLAKSMPIMLTESDQANAANT